MKTLPSIPPDQFHAFLQLSQKRLIDVRSPIEFQEGSVPESINLPLLTNQERTQIGIAYKEKGQVEAIQLGHHLVSGTSKEERIQQWLGALLPSSRGTDSSLLGMTSSAITCYRGGLRSKIVQQWLHERGLEIPRIEGGYKALRSFLINMIDYFSAHIPLLVISGSTGAGKTKLLRELATHQSKCHIIDLELAANHRGSAFGKLSSVQPHQTNFENQLALQMLRVMPPQPHSSIPINKAQISWALIEDESRLIGKNVQPTSLFRKLRTSPLVLIVETLPNRVLNTYQEYILSTPLNPRINSYSSEKAQEVVEGLLQSLKLISKKLGGLRYEEISQDLLYSHSEYLKTGQLELHQIWIEKLLRWYYDPMYLDSLKHRQPEIAFQGDSTSVKEFILEKYSLESSRYLFHEMPPPLTQQS